MASTYWEYDTGRLGEVSQWEPPIDAFIPGEYTITPSAVGTPDAETLLWTNSVRVAP